MTIPEQIEVIQALIEGVERLNGSFQSGWNSEIGDGKRLVKWLKNQMKTHDNNDSNQPSETRQDQGSIRAS